MINNFIKHLCEYLVIFLLFSSSVLFSHILFLVWIEKPVSVLWIGWYEGLKSIVLTWVSFVLVLCIFLYRTTKKISKIKIPLAIVFWIIVSMYFSIDRENMFLWQSEKYQWGIYWIWLVTLYMVSYFFFQAANFKRLIRYICVFFICIWIYGIVQKIGLDPLYSMYQTRVPLTRIFSTLGNANYLAGLGLICLPLWFIFNQKWKEYLYLIFTFSIILCTHSYIWIFFAILYLIFYISKIHKKAGILLCIVFCFSALLFFIDVPEWKLMSLKARMYMWETTFEIIFRSLKSILIGSWPDTLQNIFDTYKSPELSIYENPDYTADRSHNFMLDIVYYFWFITGWVIIWCFSYAIVICKNASIRASLILFVVFFSLNIPATIHFLIIAILLWGIYNRTFVNTSELRF